MVNNGLFSSLPCFFFRKLSTTCLFFRFFRRFHFFFATFHQSQRKTNNGNHSLDILFFPLVYLNFSPISYPDTLLFLFATRFISKTGNKINRFGLIPLNIDLNQINCLRAFSVFQVSFPLKKKRRFKSFVEEQCSH